MQIEGRAHFSKAAMLCPWLKYPITNLGGSVSLADGALMVCPLSPVSVLRAFTDISVLPSAESPS